MIYDEYRMRILFLISFCTFRRPSNVLATLGHPVPGASTLSLSCFPVSRCVSRLIRLFSTDSAAFHSCFVARRFPIYQQPEYKDRSSLRDSLEKLARLPPLVYPGEVDQLKQALAEVILLRCACLFVFMRAL